MGGLVRRAAKRKTLYVIISDVEILLGAITPRCEPINGVSDTFRLASPNGTG